MVTLTSKERKCIQAIERRADHLKERIKASTQKSLTWDKQERTALLWILEVMGHAAALNCEEAFAYTRLRTPRPDNSQEMVEYLPRNQPQKPDHAVMAANGVAA